MKRYVIACAMLLGLSGYAQAQQTIPRGQPFGIRVMICDTVDQAMQLMTAFATDRDTFTAKRLELQALKNDKGDPACGIYKGPMIAVEQLAKDDDVKMYVIHVLTPPASEYYAVSRLPLAEKQPSPASLKGQSI